MANVVVYPEALSAGTPSVTFISLQVNSANEARFSFQWEPNFALGQLDLLDSLRDEIKTQVNSNMGFTPTDAEILIFGIPFKP